ncbi:MAG TPA: beta-L-arabinofuranosidase domain-containing protein, partial [Ignavibacteriales bacterium]|nr:beta-L-arabinofuranosidase domain-containing protein [Ignavibacteriales bacterium]
MRKIVTACIAALLVPCMASAQNTNYKGNKAPLLESPYVQLPLGSVKAKGWLYDQLKQAADGVTGHLDEHWKDVGDNNGWLGGTGDSWERGPYWVDGLLPLAYILNDKELIAKSNKWVEAVLKSQTPDGFFGPVPDTAKMKSDKRDVNAREDMKRDWWPRMVMLKVMQNYYEATGDERVITFLTKYFKYQMEHLKDVPLDHYSHWSKSRGGENILVVYWLYNHTGDKFLLDLGELLFQQTEDWTGLLTCGEPKDWHGVNTGMGVKEPGVYYQYSKDAKHRDAVKQGIKDLMKYHGQIYGLWSGDELLHGTNPTQGTELCTIVEYMYSLEELLKITGDRDYAEILERVTYNALPAQISYDYWLHQYFQMANQIKVSKDWKNFNVEFGKGTEQLFGLEAGYGCCTANMHQGWPKFAANLWYATADNGLAAIVYAPSEVTAKVLNGEEVSFTEETNYPFEDKIKFKYNTKKSLSFPLHLRIPQWCEQAVITVNGSFYMKAKAGELVKVIRTWAKDDVLELALPMKVKVSTWYDGGSGIERGPLVYSLKIEEEWTKLEGTEPGATYQVTAKSLWNYGIMGSYLEHPDSLIQVETRKFTGVPWSGEKAPVVLKAKGEIIPDWQQYNGIAGPIPTSPAWMPQKYKTEGEDILLVPYGCQRLRISVFPAD